VFHFEGIDNEDVLEDPGTPDALQPEGRLNRTRSKRGGKYTD